MKSTKILAGIWTHDLHGTKLMCYQLSWGMFHIHIHIQSTSHFCPKSVCTTSALFQSIQSGNMALHSLCNAYWGQSYKTFYTFGQNYKPIVKHDNILWSRKYLVKLLGCYALKYSRSSFFLRGTFNNLGTLFYTALRLNKFYRIGLRLG